MTAGVGRAIAVVGARGGLGASSVAAGLAWRLARGPSSAGSGSGPEPSPGLAGRSRRGTAAVALVDLDRAGGGLDVLLGVEEVDGLRWPDLDGARGEVSGPELTALLPRWSGVTVLSADRARPGAPRVEVLSAVLAALGSCHDELVLDLDRAHLLGEAGGWAPGGAQAHRCATVFVVVGRDLRSVAGVLALRAALLAAAPDVRLIVRGPAPGGLGVLELAHVVDLPVAATIRPQRGFDAALERGAGPVLHARGQLARAVDLLAESLR